MSAIACVIHRFRSSVLHPLNAGPPHSMVQAAACPFVCVSILTVEFCAFRWYRRNEINNLSTFCSLGVKNMFFFNHIYRILIDYWNGELCECLCLVCWILSTYIFHFRSNRPHVPLIHHPSIIIPLNKYHAVVIYIIWIVYSMILKWKWNSVCFLKTIHLQ